MGPATFAIGLLPTYASVGVLAPILLVTVRIIQGLAFGAEWGGAHFDELRTRTMEGEGPLHRHRPGRIPRRTAHRQPGVLRQHPSWWRLGLAGAVPASIILVIVGLIIRAKVPESPVFEDVKAEGNIVKSPIVEVVKTDWRNILRGVGLRIAETAGYAVSITYMLSYLKGAELATRSQTIGALCIAAAIGIFATFAWAKLTDKIGRRLLYLWVCALGIPWGVLMFVTVNTGLFILIIATFVVAYCVFQNALAGSQGGWFPELFNANTRSSGASLAYQISAIASGFTPFITTLLYEAYGWWGPALLFSGYMAIGLVAAILTRETWGPRERKLADQAAANTATPHEWAS